MTNADTRTSCSSKQQLKIPQDKEGCGSDTSHEEKVLLFFEEAVFASEEAEALPAESDCSERFHSTLTFQCVAFSISTGQQ
ncbi:hypothetical protein EU245_09900 [Lentibacillus lipolyticus]|nr:hypothetical protein EU245_09900 [Lentibacillus lipolyticus]